jgi:hypothetical protein
MTKLEEVAAALSHNLQMRNYGCILTPWRDPAMSEGHIADILSDARAAIEAIRDPTEAMWQAGRFADEYPGDSYTKVFDAMLDAILNEEQPK